MEAELTKLDSKPDHLAVNVDETIPIDLRKERITEA